MSWVTPAFDSEDEEVSLPMLDRTGSKRLGGNARKKPKLSKEEAWVDKYSPTSKDQLAVHTKKIQEVEWWMNAATNGKLGASPIAIWLGPSGCGKTTTLQVIAKSMGCWVREWINPTNYKTDGPSTSSQEFVGSVNQVEQFEDFLLRASRYQDLFVAKPTKSLLLVEDLPNIFLHDSSLLAKTLRKYVEVGKCPLVFICNSGSNQKMEKLFKPVLSELQIKTISFNPVNKTLMCRALERILKAARKDESISESERMDMDNAMDVANGDIRFATNHLQYILLGARAPVKSCAPPEHVLPKNVGKGGPKSDPGKSTRDKAVDIFRCLGSVLYNKQTTFTDKTTGASSQRSAHDPEEISSKMSSVPNLFHGLLCENYPSVMSNVNSIAVASHVLSQTDVMLNRYADGAEKDTLKTYSINVSVHALMKLPPCGAARIFLPFKGARVKEVTNSLQKRLKKCNDLFPTSHLQPRTLLTEVSPFLAKMDMGALSSDQKQLIHEVSELTSVRFASLPYYFEEDKPRTDDRCRESTSVRVPMDHTPEEVKIQPTHEDECVDIEECFSSDESAKDELADL